MKLKHMAVGAIIGLAISIIIIVIVRSIVSAEERRLLMEHGPRTLILYPPDLGSDLLFVMVMGPVIGSIIAPIGGYIASSLNSFKLPLLKVLCWVAVGVFLGLILGIRIGDTTFFGGFIIPIIGGLIGAIAGAWVEESWGESFVAILLLIVLGIIGYVYFLRLNYVEEVQEREQKQVERSQRATATSQAISSRKATETAIQATADARTIGRGLQGLEDLKSVSISPKGQEFVSTGREIVIWNTTTLNKIVTLPGNEALVTGSSYSRDGLKLATADENGVVKIWNTQTWQELYTLNGPIKTFTIVNFSPDGQKIVVKGENAFMVWDIDKNKQLYTVSHKGILYSPMYSPDGHQIAAASEEEAYVWDADTGQEVINFGLNDGNTTSKIRLAKYSPDGRSILVARIDGTIEIWDTNSWKNTATFNVHKNLNYVNHSPDGRNIVTASDDGTAKIWSVATGKEVATLRHQNQVEFAAYSPDEHSIITLSENVIAIWDTRALQSGGIFTVKY